MQRYQWRKPSNLPDRVELLDRSLNRIIGQIVSVGRNWQWQRSTTQLLHGAPPAAGMATGLTQAKVRVLDGLPE